MLARIEALVYGLRRRVNKRRVARTFSRINAFEQSLYSQNGEDGIIRELLFRTGFANRYFVEFGAGDGSENNTAVLARHYGWSGLYIEADSRCVERLRSTLEANTRVRIVQALITRDNIGALFRENAVPEEFDVLSIDIDGNDYWVWEQLSGYRPRVVVIEYNAAFVPPRRWVMQYNPEHRWDGTAYYGASLESYALLGRRLGYTLICTDAHGVNAFFVREDLLAPSGLRAVSAAQAYHPLRYGLLGRHHRTGPERPYLEM
jgi:hypothetical protein